MTDDPTRPRRATVLDRPAPPPPLSPDPVERAQEPLTDYGHARRVLSVYGEDLIYTSERGWGAWTGTHYRLGKQGDIAARRIFETLPLLLDEEARAWAAAPVAETDIERLRQQELGRLPSRRKVPSFDPDAAVEEQRALVERHIRWTRRQTLEEAAEKAARVRTIRDVKAAAETSCLVPFESLDAEPWRLAVLNGTLDLARVVEPSPDGETEEEEAERRARWLLPHDRAMRPTRACGVAFDPTAECPEWRRFIALITSDRPAVRGGEPRPDPEMAAYLKRCLGKLLLGENKPPAALFIQGEGANGKSLMFDTIAHVLGSYVERVVMEMFLWSGRERDPAAASQHEVVLPGARCYLAIETREGSVLDDGALKRYAGGDATKSRANYDDLFEWTPSGTPVLVFNPMPEIKAADHGTQRRIFFVPLRVRLDELPQELRREQAEVKGALRAEGPGILNWLCEGLADLHALGGLCPPPHAELHKTTMLSESDPVGAFVDAALRPDPVSRVRMPDFNDVFKLWAPENGYGKARVHTAKQVLRQRGFDIGPVRGSECLKGWAWNGEADIEALRDRARRIKGE